VVKLAASQGSNKWTAVDFRKVFPAVTELTSFFHVCGDGQEAMPGEELPLPLKVGVSNGKWPVEGALVQFEIKSGDGALLDSIEEKKSLPAKTNKEGVAECKWKLGALNLNNPNVPPSQLVEAKLLDVCNNIINTPIRFNANLSVAGQVAYTLPDCAALPITCNVTGIRYQYWNEQYPVIKLFGENYIPLLANKDPIWKSHVNKLAELVLDSDEKHTIGTNEQFDLGEGYAVKARQIDVDGKKVWLEFTKDGEYVDDEIISVSTSEGAGNTWEVELDGIQGEDNIVVFRVHINQIFMGAGDSIAQIEGIWLIDYRNAKKLQIGDRFGDYKLISIVKGVDESNQGSLVFERNRDSADGFPTVKRLLEKKRYLHGLLLISQEMLVLKGFLTPSCAILTHLTSRWIVTSVEY
jgi:S-layer protein (TIGR01567 family)